MIEVGDRIRLINPGGFRLLKKEHKGTVVAAGDDGCIYAVMDSYSYDPEEYHGDGISDLDPAHNLHHFEYTKIEETTECTI